MEVWEWIYNFIRHHTVLSIWLLINAGIELIHVSKRATDGYFTPRYPRQTPRRPRWGRNMMSFVCSQDGYFLLWLLSFVQFIWQRVEKSPQKLLITAADSLDLHFAFPGNILEFLMSNDVYIKCVHWIKNLVFLIFGKWEPQHHYLKDKKIKHIGQCIVAIRGRAESKTRTNIRTTPI